MPSQKPGILPGISLFSGLNAGEIESITQLLIERRYAAATVGRRLRHLVATIESITFGSVTRRLAGFLLDMSRDAGAEAFPLSGTHQELASRLGTVREVVSRNLMRFRAAGLIRVEEHQLAILDRAGLEREAESEE